MTKKILTALLGFTLSHCALADGGDPIPSFCQFQKEVCVEAGGTRIINGLPVTEPCWKYARSYHCIDWNHFTNSCDNIPNCVPQGEPVDFPPDAKEQTYKCTEHKEEKTCVNWDIKTVCSGSDFLHDSTNYSTQPTDNFAQMASKMNMIADMTQSDIDIKNMRFYEGKVSHCHTPRPATPIAPDCCDPSIHTHGGSLVLDKCDSDELALALSRRNKATHYVGDYCKKEDPILHRCDVYGSGYCRFTDELTRIIQEQGRAQINALVAQGEISGHNTVTKTFKWSQTASQSGWHQSVINGVSVAAYTYAKPSAANIPIYISYGAPVMVNNNKTATIAGVGVSFSCNAGICTGSLNNGDNVKTIFFDPTCASKAMQSWTIGNNQISQGYCLAVNAQTPNDWLSPLTWANGVPNNWQFLAQTSQRASLTNGENLWQLGKDLTLGAVGSCSGVSCNYTFEVNNNGSKSQQQITIDLNAQGNQPQFTIGGVTVTVAYPPNGQVLAACDNGEACGALPSEDNINQAITQQTYNQWHIVNAQGTATQKFINGTIGYTGSCQNNSCTWQITSLGVNGLNTVMRSPIQWQLYNAPIDINTQKQTPQYAPENRALVTSTNNRFVPYQYSFDQPPKDTVLIKFTLSGQQQAQVINLPVKIDNDKPYVLSTSPYVSITGGCDLGIGLCKYNVASKVFITAMTWGTPEDPNCDGFTLQQLQMLDFDKMDLGEYTRDIGNQTLSPEQQAAIENSTKTGVQDFNDSFSNGTTQKVNVNGGSSDVITITPERGQAPFDVTLKAVSNYPNYLPFAQCGYPSGTNNNPISSIFVDWGDGSTTTLTNADKQNVTTTGLKYQSTTEFCDYSMPVFAVKHTYNSAGQTVLENVKVKIYALDGEHDTGFQIENEYDQEDIPQALHIGGGSSNTTENKQKNVFPNSGAFNPKDIAGTGASHGR
ncbi:MAG: conjugal transfer protein TraN [Proteobacteria bacterium]|nr:conjugal transfer protein TraN [Pseudomonadota bacterium]